MRICEAQDREHFLANRPPGVPIRVVRMPAVQLVRRNGQLAKALAIELTYSFRHGDQEWVFEETRIANENEPLSGSRIDLSDTLWAELEKTGDYRLVHRSGSF